MARLYCLKRQLPKALDVFGDVLQNPAFPQAELDRQRNIALGRLLQVRNEPNALASMAVAGTLYGQDHPYGRPQFGTPSGLKSITRDDLEAFYQRWIRPDQAALIAVGDTTLDEIAGQLEKALAGWKAPEPAVQAEVPARCRARSPRTSCWSTSPAPPSR